jgi:hypothetical protein
LYSTQLATRKVASKHLARIEREHSFLVAMARVNVCCMMLLDIQDVHSDENSIECRDRRHWRARGVEAGSVI